VVNDTRSSGLEMLKGPAGTAGIGSELRAAYSALDLCRQQLCRSRSDFPKIRTSAKTEQDKVYS
jgi:hypothetical protein